VKTEPDPIAPFENDYDDAITVAASITARIPVDDAAATG
jgi:hypothetical protein